jgi:hypothetical protein
VAIVDSKSIIRKLGGQTFVGDHQVVISPSIPGFSIKTVEPDSKSVDRRAPTGILCRDESG